MASASETTLPWRQRPSIYEHIRDHVRADGRGLLPAAWELPDETRPSAEAARFAGFSELLSVYFGFYMSTLRQDEVARVLEPIHEYCKSPTDANKQAVYSVVCSKQVSHDTIASLLGILPHGLDDPCLHELAWSLVVESVHRQPVKLGLTILGSFADRASLPLFRLLGLHDEFTLYCAAGLANVAEAPEKELWELAQRVYGCGRTLVIQRLDRTIDPQIKNWILRNGHSGLRKVTAPDIELAYDCARIGGLGDALAATEVDDELLAAAGDIIEGLVGPMGKIEKLPAGAAIIEAYLRHLHPRASTLRECVIVAAIRDFLRPTREWIGSPVSGELEERRLYLTDLCNGILGRPVWRERIMRGLDSDDEQVFDTAARAAQAVDMDAWKWHWPRLLQSPHDRCRWHYVMASCTPDRLGAVLELATRQLPLVSLCTGPTTDPCCYGADRELECCLGSVVRGLCRFPGQGWQLVAAAL